MMDRRGVMHARELIELAAVLSAHGPALIHHPGQLREAGLEEYWTASKSRLDRWGHSLKRFAVEGGQGGPGWYGRQWPLVSGVLEEVLTGEVLTRVWTAVACAHDRRHRADRAEPLARSVLIGHLEARHRVLLLLAHDPHIGAERAIKLDRLRRRTERWTDMLIGYLAGLCDISQLAIEPQRAQHFAEDLADQASVQGGRHAWTLMQASLRATFQQGLTPSSPNADLNARIAAGILGCLPEDLFDSTGLLRSLWAVRLSVAASDVQGMIAELLAGGDSAADPDSAGSPQESRIRRWRWTGQE